MGGATIDLLVLGVSHRTAPVAVRERLAIVPDEVGEALGEIASLPGVREAAMLNTCNRVELYVAADDGDRAAAALTDLLAKRAGVATLELAAHLYERRESEAVLHLFRVASSLDSLVIGEPQILGQTKQAHEAAVQRGTAGTVLSACFNNAFRVARRVRRDTAIARNPVSVSSVAVEYARTVFGDLAGRRVLVISAGKMADLAARSLRAQGAALTVINRTRKKSEELAARFGAAVHDWEDMIGALAAADIVIASTGATQPVLTRDMLAKVQKLRRGRLLCLLDIAVPRDVDPDAAKVDGVYLADIDDLQKEAAKHRADRKSEADQAEVIVEQELARFLKSWRGRQLAPTVTAFRAHVLGMAEAEANRLVAANPGLGDREKRLLRDAVEGFAKKLLHQPQMALRADDSDGMSLVTAVQQLFGLKVTAAASVDDPAAGEAEAAAGGEDKKAAGR
jgi:glutamyl-tRNA reductase